MCPEAQAHDLQESGRNGRGVETEPRRISRVHVGILGIDPGKSGGIATITTTGNHGAIKMPDTTRGVIDTLRVQKIAGNHIAFVELVGGYIGKAQPASSAFVFGYGCGVLTGALSCLGFEVHRVRPQTWMRAFGLKSKATETKTAWKNRLKSLAEDLFPDLTVTLATADALLIAEFGRRYLNGNITIDLTKEES